MTRDKIIEGKAIAIYHEYIGNKDEPWAPVTWDLKTIFRDEAEAALTGLEQQRLVSVYGEEVK